MPIFQASTIFNSLNIPRQPSLLDTTIIECNAFRAFFWASSKCLTSIPPIEGCGLLLRSWKPACSYADRNSTRLQIFEEKYLEDGIFSNKDVKIST